MRYDLPKARPRRFLLLLPVLAVTGCVGAPPIVAAGSACSALLPAEWKIPVSGARIPDIDTAAEWIAFGDAQTAQLEKANDRTSTAIGIVERCEERDRQAVSRARRPWWKMWR